MDVAAPAYGDRIAQLDGDSFYGPIELRPRRLAGLELAECPNCEHRACPGAEVLRREVVIHRRAQVGVDVVRADRLWIALLVEVLEQTLARQLLARANYTREATIAQSDHVPDARFATEAETQGPAANLGVTIA